MHGGGGVLGEAVHGRIGEALEDSGQVLAHGEHFRVPAGYLTCLQKTTYNNSKKQACSSSIARPSCLCDNPN
jgi:hypothetical protein